MGVELPDAVKRLFEGKNWAHIATLMRDGSPQVTPVWVDLDDQGRILVNTAEGRTKPRNVRRDARVAVSVTDQEKPSVAAWVRGRVVDLVHEGAWEHYDKLGHKYNGRSPGGSPDTQQRVIFVIEPEHVGGQNLG